MKISERKLHIEPRPTEETFSLNVAFATDDRKNVNQHFGSSQGMLIYGINAHEWHVLEAIEYAEVSTSTHNKLPTRISDLVGCSAVFCNACGASAVKQLLEKNIHPIKVIEGHVIHDLLKEITQELDGEPCGWLAKSLKQKEEDSKGKKAQRLSQLIDEEW